MKKKKNKSEKFIVISVIIFFLLAIYVIKFPVKNFSSNRMQQQNSLQNESWEDYEGLVLPENINAESFNILKQEKKITLHQIFLKKIQRCLTLSLTNEEEMQLVYNLIQGSTREAILRGLLAKSEVNELIAANSSALVSKETAQWVLKLNDEFLQRDDFEMPADMRNYELKILLMDEFLAVGEKNFFLDQKRFYLWSAYILKNLQKKFSNKLSNQDLLLQVQNIPIDHLLAEVPVAVCQSLDILLKN